MASHFMEGTSILTPAVFHLDAPLLMGCGLWSGCLNMFACSSWRALLSASILFSAALLISSFNSSRHITCLQLTYWPATGFSSFPTLRNFPSGFSVSHPLRKKNGWGRDLSDDRPSSSNFFLHCTTPGHLCLYKVTSCL